MRMKKIALLLVVAACGGKSSDSPNDDNNNGTETEFTYYAQDKLILTQKFDSVTPRSFKPQTDGAGLALLYNDNRETECEIAGDRDTIEYETCKLAYEIRERFFGSAGTNIRERLKAFEDRINGNIARARGGYIPCLDSEYTGGTAITIPGNPPQELTAPPFAQTAFDYVIPNKAEGVKTGLNLALSCLDSFSSATHAFKVAFGKSNGSWSLFEDQSDGKSALGTINSEGNIDLWFGFGIRSKYDGPEDETVRIDKNGNPVIFIDDEGNGDATLANIKAVPARGVIGLAVIGEYGGECGTRIIMNDTALYLRADNNRYGACFEGDVFDNYVNDNGLNSGGDHRGAYHPEWDGIELCLKVSGQVPEVGLQGLKHCIESGLITYEADGTTVADPFASIGLPYLSAKEEQASEEALRVRAWMAGQMHQSVDLSAVPVYGTVQNSAGASISKVEGFETLTYGFSMPESEAPEPIAKAAACNASDFERTEAFEEVYTLRISELFNYLPKTDAPDAPSREELEAGLLATINSGLGESGDTAPVFEIDVSGSVGATYRSLVSGSVTLQVENATIATGSFQGSSDADDLTNLANVKVNPSGIPAFTRDTILTAKVTGTLVLDCANATSAIQTAAANVGIPKLTLYAKPQSTSE